MHVWDVNGDGRADVLSSNPHHYGVWWWENVVAHAHETARLRSERALAARVAQRNFEVHLERMRLQSELDRCYIELQSEMQQELINRALNWCPE